MIAVCDHNSARNAAAVQERPPARASRCSPAWRSPRPRKRHVVGLFPDAARRRGGRRRDAARLCRPTDEDYDAFFGEQQVLDADGSRARPRDARPRPGHGARSSTRPSSSSTRHGGLAVAAHVDRRRFGVHRPARLLPRRRRLRRRRGLAPRRARLAATRRSSPCTGCRRALLGRPLPGATSARRARIVHCERRPSPSWRSPSPARTAGGRPMHDLSLYLLDLSRTRCAPARRGATWASPSTGAADSLAHHRRRRRPGLPVAPEQALDPFYTTKEGKKTGLGLSLFRQAAARRPAAG